MCECVRVLFYMPFEKSLNSVLEWCSRTEYFERHKYNLLHYWTEQRIGANERVSARPPVLPAVLSTATTVALCVQKLSILNLVINEQKEHTNTAMNTQRYNMHTIRLNDNNRVYLQESNEYVFCDYLSVSTFKYVYSTSSVHIHTHTLPNIFGREKKTKQQTKKNVAYLTAYDSSEQLTNE